MVCPASSIPSFPFIEEKGPLESTSWSSLSSSLQLKYPGALNVIGIQSADVKVGVGSAGPGVGMKVVRGVDC